MEACLRVVMNLPETLFAALIVPKPKAPDTHALPAPEALDWAESTLELNEGLEVDEVGIDTIPAELLDSLFGD